MVEVCESEVEGCERVLHFLSNHSITSLNGGLRGNSTLISILSFRT